jgi:hypothetical protein
LRARESESERINRITLTNIIVAGDDEYGSETTTEWIEVWMKK